MGVRILDVTANGFRSKWMPEQCMSRQMDVTANGHHKTLMSEQWMLRQMESTENGCHSKLDVRSQNNGCYGKRVAQSLDVTQQGRLDGKDVSQHRDLIAKGIHGKEVSLQREFPHGESFEKILQQ